MGILLTDDERRSCVQDTSDDVNSSNEIETTAPMSSNFIRGDWDDHSE